MSSEVAKLNKSRVKKALPTEDDKCSLWTLQKTTLLINSPRKQSESQTERFLSAFASAVAVPINARVGRATSILIKH